MKNWKTTLAGLLFGALTILTSPAPLHPDWSRIAGAAGIAAIGALAKDHDVTGGTREQ